MSVFVFVSSLVKVKLKTNLYSAIKSGDCEICYSHFSRCCSEHMRMIHAREYFLL